MRPDAATRLNVRVLAIHHEDWKLYLLRDQEMVQRELVDEVLEPVVEQPHGVPLAQHLRDLAGLQAGRHEPDLAGALPDATALAAEGAS